MRVRSRWSLPTPIWWFLGVLAFPFYLPSTSLPPLTQLPAGSTGSAESWHREREGEGEGDEMALTDPRQGWGEGGLQAGSTCSNPWARGWGEAHAWVLGWVCAAPILASLTRLLSWAQPSAPCLALIDLPVRGLVWPWHIFPVFVGILSPPPIMEVAQSTAPLPGIPDPRAARQKGLPLE